MKLMLGLGIEEKNILGISNVKKIKIHVLSKEWKIGKKTEKS